MMCTQLRKVTEAQEREISLLRDKITAAASNMGIPLNQSDAIHEDINEQWGQTPKVEVDENIIVEVDQRQPVQVEKSTKIAITKGGLNIHLH